MFVGQNPSPDTDHAEKRDTRTHRNGMRETPRYTQYNTGNIDCVGSDLG